MDRQVEKCEMGKEIDKEDIERLEEVREQVSFMGGKGYLTFLFITWTFFWLPMLILDPPKR
ncbi:hypothetical protein D1839_13100 [Roseburia sp. 1XD42-34]|nr:hypothetical protein [Roseburia sp. 1XD42-34]RKI76234.1 hypothetical protein D7V87_13725 [Clostridium sp. 1xD42-85]